MIIAIKNKPLSGWKIINENILIIYKNEYLSSLNDFKKIYIRKGKRKRPRVCGAKNVVNDPKSGIKLIKKIMNPFFFPNNSTAR
jgi:hypothetical protein